jgi:hypothetical protein
MAGFIKRLLSTIVHLERSKYVISLAKLLGLDASSVDVLANTPSSERETVFASILDQRVISILDWRADIGDVYDALKLKLNTEHYSLLPNRSLISKNKIGGQVLELSKYLNKSGLAVRLTESLGDSYFLFIISSRLAVEFDAVAKEWAINVD